MHAVGDVSHQAFEALLRHVWKAALGACWGVFSLHPMSARIRDALVGRARVVARGADDGPVRRREL